MAVQYVDVWCFFGNHIWWVDGDKAGFGWDGLGLCVDFLRRSSNAMLVRIT